VRNFAILLSLLGGLPAGALGHEVGTGKPVAVGEQAGAMVVIPGGTFVMGIDEEELANAVDACKEEFGPETGALACEQMTRFQDAATGQAREVYVSPFFIDRFETTAAEYRRCVKAGACDLTPLVAGDRRFIQDDLPIVNVSWFDADAYCAWQGKRLPTEAEWEKAARGDDGRRWPWGNVDGDDRANRGKMIPEELRPVNQLAQLALATMADDSDGWSGPAPPGTFRWGKSPYGVYDMAGNVAEWVSDWWSQFGYTGLSVIDPRGVSSGPFRVVRGGSFNDPRFFARVYYRNSLRPGTRSVTIGFRCVRDIR
jgi:formylglycine-generating enzyme required for sulfatase activity